MPLILATLVIGCNQPEYESVAYVNISNESLDLLDSLWQMTGDFRQTSQEQGCSWYEIKLPQTQALIGIMSCIRDGEKSITGVKSYAVYGSLTRNYSGLKKKEFENGEKELDDLMEQIRQAMQNKLGREVKKKSYYYHHPVI